MSILSGFFKTKKYRKTPNGYKLQSLWTSSETVEMGDGNTVETNLGAIQGITSSLATENDNYALSATAGKNLQDQITTVNTDLAANYHWKSYGRVTAIGLTSTCTMDDILVALYKKGNFSMLCTPMWKIDYPNINFATSSNRHILTVKVAESGYVLVSDFDVNTGIEYVCGHDGDNYTAWLSTAAVP